MGFSFIILRIGINAASKSKPNDIAINVATVIKSTRRNGKTMLSKYPLLRILLNAHAKTNTITRIIAKLIAEIINVSSKNILVISLLDVPSADKIPISFFRFAMLKEIRLITSSIRTISNMIHITANTIESNFIVSSNS